MYRNYGTSFVKQKLVELSWFLVRALTLLTEDKKTDIDIHITSA